MSSAPNFMHRRLADLASAASATFSIVVDPSELVDAVVLADAQGWVFVDTKVHAAGLLLRFERLCA